MATKTVLAVLAVTLAIGAGCASSGGGQPDPPLAPDVAAGLADRAEQVAAALDAGRCDEALAGARTLQNDIAALPVDAALRAEALAGAARLVSGISCPPPVTAPPTSVPAVDVPDVRDGGKSGKGKGKGKGHDDDD
jgi:hypothetical protein